MKYLLYISLILILLCRCQPTKVVTTQAKQFAALYNPSEYSLNIDYQIYHISDDLSSLYIRIFPRELVFNNANTDSEYRALVQIDYTIFELDQEGKIVSKADSSNFSIKLGPGDQDKTAFFITKVLQIPSGKKYLIRLDSRDMYRGTVGLKHLYIDKENDLSGQNFSIISPQTGFPKFLNYFSTGEVFRINYRKPGLDTLFVDFFKTDREYPKPPVEVDSPPYYSFKSDTCYIVPFSDSLFFTLPVVGMYRLRIDTTKQAGLTLHNFGPDFPHVKSNAGLMGPIFYIATLTEYRNLKQETNEKRAIDDFWLKRTSSMDRSRELIRVYYNRVLYSNLYFTAGAEGWKTDRGMLFILFGPPDRMKDTGNEQHWYYISRKQRKVIEFIFERKSTIFSDQDLVWKKNVQAMQYWSAAVSSWRSGKIYSLGK